MLNPMNHADATVTDVESATSVTAMRNACHNILYTVVNSRSYNDENAGYHMYAVASDPSWSGCLCRNTSSYSRNNHHTQI